MVTVTKCDAPEINVCPACGKRAISISMEDLYEVELPPGDVCENDPHFFHPRSGDA